MELARVVEALLLVIIDTRGVGNLLGRCLKVVDDSIGVLILLAHQAGQVVQGVVLRDREGL